MLSGNYNEYLMRIAAGFICGLVLGFERKSRQHTVGMRTLILISVSSTLLCILSVFFVNNGTSGGDPARIAAGVVTGVGFLGGGAILRQGFNIRGLTSAAIIWTAAALGLACGAGLFFIAGVTLFITISSLLILEKIEWRFFPAGKTKQLILVYSGSDLDITEIQKIISESGLVQRDMNMTEYISKKRILLKFSVKASGEFNLRLLAQKLTDKGSLIRISISDSED